MQNYPRHRANTPKDIFCEDYKKLLTSAKRKHNSEFYIFLTNGWYSESAVDIFGNSIEHWKKQNGKWSKIL